MMRIFSMEEMKRYFDPNHISKSASTFNQTKLEWLNAHYIKNSDDDELATQLVEFGVDIRSHAKKHLISQQYKQRAKTLVEMAEGIKVLLNRPSCYDEKAYKKICNRKFAKLTRKICGYSKRKFKCKGVRGGDDEIFGRKRRQAKGSCSATARCDHGRKR